MTVRIPDSALRESTLFSILLNQGEVARLEQQISTGKRVQGPQDDAAAYSRAKDLRGVLTSIDQYRNNIGRAEDHLGMADVAMNSMESALVRAKEIAVQMANGTFDATQRDTMSTEVQHLIDEMVILGNTQLDGRYIFSGNLTTTQPFDAVGTYLGDNGTRDIEVGEGVTTTVNVPGDDLLKGTAGGSDVFLVLTDLLTALQTNDVPTVQLSIDNLDPAIDQITQARMRNGLKLNALDRQRSNLEDVEFQSQQLLSEQEDTDLASAISELVLRQNTLEATRSTLGRILSSRTLLDFIG